MIDKILSLLPRLNAVLQRIKSWLAVPQRQLQPLFEWLTSRNGEKFDDSKLQNFIADADYAIIDQEPVRARALLKVLGVIVVLFLLWASFAKVSEVTRGEGKVIPYSQVQLIQSMDGGIVSQLLVHEGDVVEKGQVLIRLDQTRFLSTMKEGRAQYLALLAKAARLRALANGSKFAPPPEVAREDPDTLKEEYSLYESKNAELTNTIAMTREQLMQRRQELEELKSKREQAARQYVLTAKELAATKPLVATGAVSDVEILRLERDVAKARGDRDIAAAQILRVEAAIAETADKVEAVELTFRNDARKDLADTMAKLNSVGEGNVGLEDKVARSVLRSPVKGTVESLKVNTVGGVIEPGKVVAQIVPMGDNLILETRIAPKDIAFLHPGLKATVKLSAYDFVIYGGLEGTVDSIGADTMVDEKGNAYYIVRIKTNKTSLGKNMPILPGMVAEVDILTGEKSVLSYLLKPVLRAKSRALTER